MLKDVKVDGNQMIVTLTLVKPYQSKSALKKAEAAGVTPDKVPANVVCSSGGFVRFGNHRISINVLTA